MMATAANENYLGLNRERATIELMAEAIAEITDAHGLCLPHELNAKGFTLDEINRHWTAAKAAAHFRQRISKR